MSSNRYSVYNHGLYEGDEEGKIESQYFSEMLGSYSAYSVNAFDVLRTLDYCPGDWTTRRKASSEEVINACKEVQRSHESPGGAFQPDNRSLAHLLIFNKLEDIIRQLKSGEALTKVMAPYQTNDAKYVNPELYASTQAQIVRNNADKMISLFNQSAKNNWHHISSSVVDYFMRLSTDPKKYLDKLPEVMNGISRADYPRNFNKLKQFLLGLPDNLWTEIEASFPYNEKVLTYLARNEILSTFLEVLTQRQKTYCANLLKNPALVNTLAKVLSPDDLITFLSGLPDEFFKAFLMHGFNYDPYLAQALINHKPQAKLIYLEILVRGEKGHAEQVNSFLTQHQRNLSLSANSANVAANNNSLFASARSESLETKSKYNEMISISIPDLIAYMKLKYDITENKNDLYFIKNTNDFVGMLFQLGIVIDKREFKAEIAETFHLPLPLEDAAIVSRADQEDRISHLEREKSKLRDEVRDLEGQVAKLTLGNSLLQDTVLVQSRRITELEERQRTTTRSLEEKLEATTKSLEQKLAEVNKKLNEKPVEPTHKRWGLI